MRTVLFLSLATSAFAAPLVQNLLSGPTVSIQNGTIVGSSNGLIDTFNGIPFARPPTGTLRLKPPQTITATYGTITATGMPQACPQPPVVMNTTLLPTDAVNKLLSVPSTQSPSSMAEDCLTLNVQRPSSATPSSKLPVVFWIYGGGFEFGSTQTYDASSLIGKSISLGQDIIYVAVNYRVGGFGWLAGKELQNDGSTNLGLRDQRLGMQWVQDNIAAFGGDPTKVTIWGESAGSISVCDHTLINGGDNSYNGGKLFRGAMMDSGSLVPAETVSSPKAQAVYDAVASYAGCSSAPDTLACLRALPYTTFYNAVNSVPGIFSYQSVDLAYLPRPDPASSFFSTSPELSAQAGNFTKVPIIIGDQEDEGTLFSLTQSNITTTDELVTYVSSYFPEAKPGEIAALVSLYPDDPSAGSPFNTGDLNEIYPQFKRLAAILGDLTFTLTRRAYLSIVSSQVPAHSYLSSYFYGTPVLGTFHASDLLAIYYDAASPVAAQSIQTYYISFINSLDPNNAAPDLLTWPRYDVQNRSLLNFQTLADVLLPDTFRMEAYNFLANHTSDLRV